ncbi:hypothetical protein LXL04_018785 [Taraxacum kok-saghyz]
MEENAVRIIIQDATPSAEEFTSQLEPKNVPTVFHGCVNDWKAFSKWNPSIGGLDYLQGLAGSSSVEVMLSKSAPVFYGDIRNHERVQLPLSTFIEYCKNVSNPDSLETEQDQIYLAQVPIMNTDKEEKVQLGSLINDIQTPLFLETKNLASINLWINGYKTRSSTHYDPHHNLLCVVSGTKQVDLWPPSSTPLLYPMPLYGEASNHSGVPIDVPDLSLHPRSEHLKKYSQRVVLHSGDALFIPEGWFHQVDSESLTIAVNFWWRSEIMCGMSEHMDSYYLRRILKRLTDKEMNRMLCNSIPCVNNKQSDNNIKLSSGNGNMLHNLEPSALRSLHELVSLVHDRVSVDDLNSTSDINKKESKNKIEISELYYMEDDPVATTIWTLEPLNLHQMFLAMVHHFPRTLEGLVLHLLSPVGAEVLTRKFDEMDQLINEEDRNEFYRLFYGVFDDQFAVMDKLLNRKESFSSQAFKNVMDQFLGVKVQ